MSAATCGTAPDVASGRASRDRWLIQATGAASFHLLATEQQLVGLLKECYPNLPGIVVPTVSPRIKAKIETLLDAYRNAESERDPTCHAGTGPATRP
jgi:hypothetical protein